MPITFTTGEVHVVTFASKAPSGFSDAHLEDLRRAIRPLIVSEQFARLTTRACEDLGSFELKGVPSPVRLLEPCS